MTLNFEKRRTKCPLCGLGKISFHFAIDHKAVSFNTDICKSCGFIFMNPSLTDKSIASLYSEDYYSGRSDFSYIDERKAEHFAKYTWNARIKNIRKYIKNGNFLDIGASFGGFLSCASLYFNPFGVEISKYAGQFTRKRFGSSIHIGTLESAKFPKNKFSVITMIEVIEHLKDPKATINKCFELLCDNGLLLLQTADMDGWQSIDAGASYHYYLPGHLSYFSEKSLKKALYAAGFDNVKVFRPVDFGLLPKLLKSRGEFKSLRDYKRWITIARYHFAGKFKFKGRPLTSSMVVYAFKSKK